MALKDIFEAISGVPSDKYSWIDLDDAMRGRLKRAAGVAVLLLLAIILLSLYFYLQLPPLRDLVARLSGNVEESIRQSGEIPSWILWTGGTFFAILLAVTGVFAWALIDFGRMHRNIDRITFRLVSNAQKQILRKTIEILRCPEDSKCQLRLKQKSAASMRSFMNDFFYFFANAEKVGEFNQEEKRRIVFSVWTHYYISNFVFIYLLLFLLWFVFITFISNNWWPSLSFVILSVLVIFWWRWRGRRYRREVERLTEEQLVAFHRYAREKFKEQAKNTFTVCEVPKCPLY